MPRSNPTELKLSEVFIVIDSNYNPISSDSLAFIGRRAAHGYLIKNWDAKTRREDGLSIISLEDYFTAESFARNPEVHH